MSWTPAELMVTAAARELNDGDSVFVGVGIPMLASNLAKSTHAPNIQLIYESGIIGSPVSRGRIPTTVGAPKLVSGSIGIIPMFEGFSTYLQGGNIDIGFLSGAQIDRFGNINSTVIGGYENPDVRLPGSGGACEIAVNADRTVAILPHERRRFPQQVDFITSPGYIDEKVSREELGMTGGPEVVVTDKAILRFADSGEMYVDEIHPGVAHEEVNDATGWDIQFAKDITETSEPSDNELQLLREELDPTGVYIGDP